MSARAIVSLLEGRATLETWRDAEQDEPRRLLPAAPRPCKCCPLREGGEWREGAAVLRGERIRWSCHAAGTRACAGMAEVTRA
jgi:hypothetical protein